MSFVLYMIAVALASTQPEAAAMIKGAVEAYVGASPSIARQLNLVETEHWTKSGRANSAPAGPTWTGTKRSPSPLPTPPKPSMSFKFRAQL